MQRRASRALVVLVACALGALDVAHATAQSERRVAVSWARLPGAEPCVDAAVLAWLLEAHLREARQVSAADAELLIEATVAPEGAGFTAVLSIMAPEEAAEGTRRIHSDDPTCHELGEAVALSIALMVDELSAEVPPDDEEAIGESRPPRARAPAAPDAAPSAAPERAPSPRDPLELGLVVSSTMHVGLVPSPAFGATVLGLLRREGVGAIALELTVLAATEADAGGGRGAEIGGAWGGAFACPLSSGHRVVRGELCAGMALGRLRAAAFGFAENDRASLLLASAAVRADVGARIVSGLFAYAGAAGYVPFVRPSLLADDGTGATSRVFESAPIAGSFELGLRFVH